eukprot:6462651-Amphidinium_carterae.1
MDLRGSRVCNSSVCVLVMGTSHQFETHTQNPWDTLSARGTSIGRWDLARQAGQATDSFNPRWHTTLM